MSERFGKPTLTSYLKEHTHEPGGKKNPGPYVTISPQWGCDGLELCECLIDKLNERDPEQRWKCYHKELLRQLAEDTGLSEDVIEKERVSKPSLVRDFLRGLTRDGIPDPLEVRHKISILVRTAAFEGYAVILGQGGTAATGELDNGLHIRVVAPNDWRVARICIREGLDKETAQARIDQVEAEREQLKAFYERQNPRIPPFNLVLDNSVFNSEQMCQQILLGMEQRGLISKLEAKGKAL